MVIDFDGLRTDRSWQLTWSGDRLDEAVFRLAPDTVSGRHALVERLGADATDPEQWEAALIEALLTDPAAAGLRQLELHLDGAVFPRRAPSVVTLALEIRSDVFGTECPVEQLDELDPAGYPALRHLDLSRAEFDAGDLGTLEALAGSPILPRLESLKIKSLQIQEYETGGDPLEALTGLAPAFAHLALSVAGEIDVEGAARVLPLQTC